MVKQYVLTLTAKNRIGILAAVANAISELGGDLYEARQIVVQKFFSLILVAEFPDHRKPNVIVDHIRDIGRPYGIEVCLKNPDEEIVQSGIQHRPEWQIATMTGMDAPGALRQITARLAQDGIDVIQLHALRNDENGSFTMRMKLTIPPSVDVLQLQRELEENNRNLELSVEIQRGEVVASAWNSG
jgi:glycine cleavage system transcriptional repressor